MSRGKFWLLTCGLAAGLLSIGTTWADEPISVKNFKSVGENNKEEPLAKQFSLAKAVQFLDSANLEWQTKRGCFTCHTNYPYVFARPSVSDKGPAHEFVRRALEEQVKKWPDPKGPAPVQPAGKKVAPPAPAHVMHTAMSLAYNDAKTTGKLHPLTRTALERMWTVQREDGGFSWIKCNWRPQESDDHFGVTIAALAVGVAPDNYAQTEAAQKGLAGIRKYLQANPPQHFHHRTMLLWVSAYLPGFMEEKEKSEVIKELKSRQLPDGGWSAATFGNWKRADNKDQDFQTGDGYGTGYAVFMLRQAGVPASDPGIQRGLSWLKSNQRESGRWFTRSLNRDNKQFLTNVGTAFAIMALQACAEPRVGTQE